MILPNNSHVERCNARPGRIAASLTSVISFLRGLRLFVSARPKTPLRVLCVMAFDTLHVFRKSERLPVHKLRILATLLDFGACANASFDNKGFCRKEYRTTRRLLENAGISSSVDEYLRRLRELEKRRPSPGGDHWQYAKVRSYRESVVRLSLGVIASTAFGNQSVEDGIRATHCDEDLKNLFRIVMQCQVINDVLDYSKDASAGLPSFLTVPASLPQAFELTRRAAIGYADGGDLSLSGDVFRLRVALFGVSICTKLAIALGRWRQKVQRLFIASDRSNLGSPPTPCRWKHD